MASSRESPMITIVKGGPIPEKPNSCYSSFNEFLSDMRPGKYLIKPVVS
jgi:hypothetical protein